MGDLSKIDLAWVAGILDGEGYVGAYKMGNFTRLKVAVTNTDPKMILKLYDMFGGNLYAFPPSPRKQVYSWSVQDSHATKVIAQVFPYLVTKADQARIALKFADTYVDNGKKLADGVFEKRKEWAEELKRLKKSSPYSSLWKEKTGKSPSI